MNQTQAPQSDRSDDRADFGPLEIAAGSSVLVAMWALYGLTFRQHLHGRRWLVMAVLLSLPAGLAILIRATADEDRPIVNEFFLAYMLVPHALLPIVALAYAAGVIRDEQEDQTLTYLLIRPIPRWAIFTVKLLATLTTTVILTTVFTAATFFAIYVGGPATFSDVFTRCWKTIAVHDLAVIVYCCLFGLISLFTRFTLLFGILYTVAFEGVVANMPFAVRLVTVIYYGRSIAYQALPFKITEHGQTEDFGEVVWQFDPAEMSSIPECIAVLVVAALVFTTVASMMCARREFHVKTPES
jgi:ABC-2 type transport system permease protein